MPKTLDNTQLARDLASRLEVALGSPAYVFQYTKSTWSVVTEKNPTDDIHTLVVAALQKFNRQSEQPFILRHNGSMVVVVNACLDALVPTAVAVVLPEQNERLVSSLVAANLEALQYCAEASVTKRNSEYFIDQVTQDFEELTWLRSANEYFDLCGSKHTIESIARKCLPDLANVIRAECILFVRSYVEIASGMSWPDWTRVIATGFSEKDQESCIGFLADSVAQVARGPRVVNIKATEDHLPRYPGLRNCIALSVAKGPHVYGWILAINKIPSENATPTVESQPSHPKATPFGTFEAGLLSAAANIMSSHARNLELFEAQESLLTGIVRAIINSIDAKDPYTCGHSDRVAMYAKRIAARLGESAEECERIYMAGLLHDVGKIGVPDSILAKPGALTEDEYAIVKKHPEIGYAILKHLNQLDYVLPGVLHHHEAVDGSGYPSGLTGESIPLHGRILAVADAYDAMTSDRPYRPGMPSETAESILRSEAGKMWDSDIVSVFLECLANDEIQPHTVDPIASADTPGEVANSNISLMRRIANSINSLVVE